jgi:hypothetical protein
MPHAFWTSFLEHKEQMEKFEEQLRTRSGIRLVQRGKGKVAAMIGAANV